MADEFSASGRTRIKRKAHRATYDRASLYSIMDEALIASVAVVVDGQPYVQPMIHVRVGDDLILHGLATNRVLGLLIGGAETCINITLIDSLVLARRIEDHSLHYRSVTLYARAVQVNCPREKLVLMEAVFAALVRSGRYAALPPLDPGYLKGTAVLRLPIREAVGKVNKELPDSDGPAGIWSGLIPLALKSGDPEPDQRTKSEGVHLEPALALYRRN